MDKLSYALGMDLSLNMKSSGINDINIDDFIDGFKDTMNGIPKISNGEAAKLLRDCLSKLEKESKEEKSLKANEIEVKFFEDNLKSNDIKSTSSGLQYKIIKEGTGKTPNAHSRVKCHYEGTLLDGTIFDSSYKRQTPEVFYLNQIIPGWTEGLQLMKEGSKYIFYIPYRLAYGEYGVPNVIPPYSTLIFTVELLSVL